MSFEKVTTVRAIPEGTKQDSQWLLRLQVHRQDQEQ